MNVTLFDRNPFVFQALQNAFEGTPAIVAHCEFQELDPHECIATPGNAFGLMSGTFDHEIKMVFGDEIEGDVQREIAMRYGGIQPVGSSIVVPTGSAPYGLLCYAPTVMVPSKAEPHAPFLCMWSILSECQKYLVESVAVPGLGTGVGRIEPEHAARLMKIAYDEFFRPKRTTEFYNWSRVEQLMERIEQ